jgi:REP element-mobilizing transposase RayT
MIWGTLNRERLLSPGPGAKISAFLSEYAEEKGIYMKINFVNAEHVHVLIDLPTNLTIQDAAKLLKGASSHWINEKALLTDRFGWGAWLWRLLGFSIRRAASGQIYRESSRTSPDKILCGRI